MPRPLQRTYSPTAPYVVERHDQESGGINYEIWDRRPDHYRRVCVISDEYDSQSFDEDEPRKRPLHNAKSDAELIARALNKITAEEAPKP